MERTFEIESWEPDLEKYDDSVKEVYHDKMIYRAKTIGNANQCNRCHVQLNGPFDVTTWVYELSGLRIIIVRSIINCSDGSVHEQPLCLKIRSKENPDEILYETGIDPVEGEWKKTFEELFKSSLDKESIKISTLN